MTTEQLSALLETPAAFREWLQSKEPGEAVGVPNTSGACPLAVFAFAGRDIHFGAVLDTEITWVDAGKLRELFPPRWVGEFITAMDETDTPVTITAAECLRILDEIGEGDGV